MDYYPTDNGNPGITQGVCPLGWNLPTYVELTELADHLGGISVAGGKLKEAGTIHWSSPNTGGTNASGFTALPGGNRIHMGMGYFGNLNHFAWFWSSTDTTTSEAWYQRLSYNNSEAISDIAAEKTEGFSVRCLRDSSKFICLTISDKNFRAISRLDFTVERAVNTIIIFNSSASKTINILPFSNYNSSFSLNRTSAILSPGDSINLTINFNPPSKGRYLDTLFIESDDPFQPIMKIPIEGIYQTEVPCGVIKENTTWTKENSPYYVGCNLAIAQNVTLTIEPGVTVLIDSMIKIIVDGTLDARGTQEDTIQFISKGSEKFDQIQLRQGSLPHFEYFKIKNATTAINSELDSLSLKHGKIYDCITGINQTLESDIIPDQRSLLIDSLTFENCTSNGIYISISPITLTNSKFIKCYNGISAGHPYIGILLLESNIFQDNNIGVLFRPLHTSSIEFEVNNNSFIANNIGIEVNKSGKIVNNIIRNNRICGIQIVETSILHVEDNIIANNDGLGIEFISYGEESIFERNSIFENGSHGILLSAPSIIRNNSIYNNGGCGIKTSNLPIINNNNIYGNSDYNIFATKQSSETIDAINNYWGLTQREDISNSIYDYYDDGTTVKVDFEPYLIEEAENSLIDFALNDTACQGEVIPTLTAIGDSIIWYSEPDFTGPLYSGNTFETGKSSPGIYTYYITQTRNELTTLKDTATLVIISNPVIDSIEKTDESGCKTVDGSIRIYANNDHPLFYSIDNGITYFDEGAFTNLDNDNYHIIVKNTMGCISDVNTVEVLSEGDIPPPPITSGDSIYCPGDQLEILTAQAISGGTISWYEDPGLTKLKFAGTLFLSTGEDSTITYYATETVGGCESPASQVTITIIDTSHYEVEEICLVTADLMSGKNMVIWEKTPDKGIASYNIYREGNLVGSKLFHEESSIIDTEVNPETRSYLYYLSSVDSCGNESELSSYHKPLFLQFISSEGGVNLQWSKYEMENGNITLNSYSIYRGSEPDSMQELDTGIPSAIDRYTDKDPTALEQRYYYRIAGVLTNPCLPTGAKKAGAESFLETMSNLDDNNIVSIGSLYSTSDLKIYPNPANDRTTIQFSNPQGEKYQLRIIDGRGRVVHTDRNIIQSQIEFHRGNLPAGMYLVELSGSEIYRGRFVLK